MILKWRLYSTGPYDLPNFHHFSLVHFFLPCWNEFERWPSGFLIPARIWMHKEKEKLLLLLFFSPLYYFIKIILASVVSCKSFARTSSPIFWTSSSSSPLLLFRNVRIIYKNVFPTMYRSRKSAKLSKRLLIYINHKIIYLTYLPSNLVGIISLYKVY